MNTRTAHEVIRQAYEEQPYLRLAVSRSGDAIGAWDKNKERFVMVAGRAIGTGEWIDMPYELLINGKPPVSEWTEVPK